MRILHVITGLGRGGAETQLARLLSYQPAGAAVFSIREPGSLAEAITAAGVPVYSGGARGPMSPRWLPKLRQAVRQHRPEIVSGWMYHGNLAAILAWHWAQPASLLWNIRHSLHDLRREKTTTRYIIQAGAMLSTMPARIFYNSTVAASQHEAIGYRAKHRQVIPNGFDTDRFRPDPAAREALRRELGIGPHERLIGVVGRSHPMKNHVGFLSAFAQLRRELRGVCAIIVGSNVDAVDGDLVHLRTQLGLEASVHLMPDTPHPERVYPALDLFVLPSSWGEAFPNVVGEAMACGVPCLVTDVGDVATVVGDTGFVASSGVPEVLAARMAEALACSRAELAELGERARHRIETNYSADRVAQAYYAACEMVLAER